MQVILYNCSEPPNKVNKTLGSAVLNIADAKTLEGSISRDTPVIRIKRNTTAYTANYAYIPAFASYYFIEDFGEEQGGIMLLYLRVDVLKTDAVGINNSTGHIIRSSVGNSEVPDPMCILNPKSTWTRHGFDPLGPEDDCFVIIKGGGESSDHDDE